MTFIWHTACCEQNHSCAEKGARAHRVSRSSMSVGAREKDGCLVPKVERWEMFPPRIAGVMNSANFFNVPPWRARILHASSNFKLNSATPCVGPG